MLFNKWNLLDWLGVFIATIVASWMIASIEDAGDFQFRRIPDNHEDIPDSTEQS